jgi:hypothetical protein
VTPTPSSLPPNPLAPPRLASPSNPPIPTSQPPPPPPSPQRRSSPVPRSEPPSLSRTRTRGGCLSLLRHTRSSQLFIATPQSGSRSMDSRSINLRGFAGSAGKNIMQGIGGFVFGNETSESKEDSYVERSLDRISNGTIPDDRRSAMTELQSVVMESRSAQMSFGAMGISILSGP